MGTTIGIGNRVGSSGSRYWTPLNLAAVVLSDTAIDLTWTGGKLAKVEQSTDGVTYIQIGTGVDSYSDTGLTADTHYYYRVSGGLYFDVVDTWTEIAIDLTARYVSPTGSGTDYTYASPGILDAAITAASTVGDTVILKQGTYTYSDGVLLDYLGVQANDVTIKGVNKTNVIIDFHNSGDAAGWLYVQKTGVTIKDLEVRNNASTSQVLYLLSNSSGFIENIKFVDTVRRCITVIGGATQGNWKIRRNKFIGLVNTGDTTSSTSVMVDGSSNPVDVDFEYNVFMPSANNLSSGIYLNGTPGAARSVDFYNNEFYGIQTWAIRVGGANYTGAMRNNVFVGNGIYTTVGGYRAIEGACAGYATAPDYNINFGCGLTPAYYDAEITAQAHDIDGDYLLKVKKFPVDSFMLLSFDDTSGWNTAGWSNYKNLIETYGWKMTSFLYPQWWDSDYGGTPPGAELASYIAAGHDVGVHTFSHTPLDIVTPAITIAYGGGGTKDVAIVTDCVAGGADWKTIIKDYTQWTGSITIDVGGAGEDTLDLYSGGVFKTFLDIKTWVETHADWTATVGVGSETQIAQYSPAISLANVTPAVGAGTAFAVDAVPYIWMETKFAKDRLEAVILSVTGSAYTVKTFATAVGGRPTDDSMDALMEAGYLVGRANNTVVGVVADAWNTYRFAPYCLSLLGGTLTTGDDAACVANVEWITNYVGSMAGGGALYVNNVHTANIDHPAELTAWEEVFAIFADFEQRGVRFLSVREFADLTTGSDFSVIAGTIGSDLRVKYTHTEQFDGEKETGSLAIDAGVDVSLTPDIDYITVVAPPNIGAYE